MASPSRGRPRLYLDQVHQGVHLGGDYYLRRFPVWFNFRGNSSVLLSEAKLFLTAAQVRGDLGADDLAQKQAQWFMGRNPFSASIMYGEGYDWTPLYSVRSGQMVGALPVGIETKGNNDAPYWPTQNLLDIQRGLDAAGRRVDMADARSERSCGGAWYARPGNRHSIEFRDTHTGLIKIASANLT